MNAGYIILIILGTAAIAAFLVFVSTAVALKQILKPRKRLTDELIAHEKEVKIFCDEWLNVPCETWKRVSRYGYEVTGYYYDFGFDRIMVCLHGHNSSHISQLKYMDMFRSLGFDVFIPDHRHAGNSGGDTVTMGAKEKWDVVDWLQLIRERRPGKRISIFGESMGAATAIMVTAIDWDLGYLIEYCGYANFQGLLARYFKSQRLRRFFAKYIRFVVKYVYRFDSDECDAEKAMKRISCPVLIIHSESDETVPYENALILYGAKPDARFKSFKAARHACSIKTYHDEFVETIKDFVSDAEKACKEKDNVR